MDKYKSRPDVDREFKELDFGTVPQKLQRSIWTYMRGSTQK